MVKDKRGRGRQYRLKIDEGCENRDAAFILAAFDELSERVIDQVEDLEPDEMDRRPEGVYFSVGKLMVHLIKGEAGRLSKLGGMELPEDMKSALACGDIMDRKELPENLRRAGVLVNLCRRVREEITRPALRKIREIDKPVFSSGPLETGREVLMHLIWHWTYHSGHIGMVRLLLGSDYKWSYAENSK